ncbi:MAG: hypothetical protein WBA10_13415 [Elainellaceae cyanobacterium]
MAGLGRVVVLLSDETGARCSDLASLHSKLKASPSTRSISPHLDYRAKAYPDLFEIVFKPPQSEAG